MYLFMKKLAKSEAERQIKEFFSNLKDKTPKQVKKIKKLAMKHNLHLGKLRKLFCKKCYSPYNLSETKIRINKGIKSITCRNCDYVNRWGMK